MSGPGGYQVSPALFLCLCYYAKEGESNAFSAFLRPILSAALPLCRSAFLPLSSYRVLYRGRRASFCHCTAGDLAADWASSFALLELP